MALDPRDLPVDVLAFLTERHLATLTTLRPDGTPHVVAIGFTFEPETATVRVITNGTSTKAGNVERGSARAVVAQVDGGRWLALEGVPRLRREPDAVAEAVRRYALRYRQPGPNPARVSIEIAVDRVLGRG